jgi:ABC-3C protein
VSADNLETLDPLPPPISAGRLTNQQILLGQRRDPSELIKLYSQDDWEMFIREWVESLRRRYREVRRASGSGDKGRDIIGYVGEVNASGPWDNFQCKHYDHPLQPADLWKELAKLCYYTFTKKYSVPRAYYFVAPQGVGPEVLRLLERPEDIRAGLISRWEKGDILKVAKNEIPLEGALRQYVEAFDFTIIKDVPPSKIIDAHRETRFHAARFGGGLVRLPPDKVEVPAEIAGHESRYVEQLLLAYGDHLSQPVAELTDLQSHPALKRHFDRQRTHFYLAELLRNFTRDNIPEDGCFERLQDAIYDGVIDTAEASHPSGFERVKKTIEAARAIQIDSHPLKECLEGYHRSGVCHQLANDDRLTWVP